MLLVDNFSFTAPKTADAIKSLSAIAKGADKKDLVNKSKNSALVVLSERNEAAEKSFRNLGNMLVSQAKDINPVDLLTYKYVILADHKATLETLEKRVA